MIRSFLTTQITIITNPNTHNTPNIGLMRKRIMANINAGIMPNITFNIKLPPIIHIKNIKSDVIFYHNITVLLTPKASD